MISLQYDLGTDSESEAFFGAFFKFVEAASLEEVESISIHSDTVGDHMVRTVTFGDDQMAGQFETYWSQRRRWLGL